MVLLEEAARLLYREWFVPSSFPRPRAHTNCTLVYRRVGNGSVPSKRWRCSVAEPRRHQRAVSRDGDIPFFTQKDAVKWGLGSRTERSITEAGLSVATAGCIPRRRFLLRARGTVGKLNMAQRPMAMSQSCYALVGKAPVDPTPPLLGNGCSGSRNCSQHAGGAVFDAIVVDTFRAHSTFGPGWKNLAAF